MSEKPDDRMVVTADDEGRSVYIGLTFAETTELDALIENEISYSSLEATEAGEARWVELLEKHGAAQKQLFVDGFRWPDPRGLSRRGSVNTLSFRPTPWPKVKGN